jgi:hypothetical protein
MTCEFVLIPLILLGFVAIVGALIAMAILKLVIDFKYSGTVFHGENKHLELL